VPESGVEPDDAMEPTRESYCRSCYRDLPDPGRKLCDRCSDAPAPPPSSRFLVPVVLAGGLLLAGVLTLNPRLCLAGAAVGAIAIGIWLLSLK
jgi:hypothetical protein